MMLDWLTVLFDKLTAFVPRYEKIPPTDRLVKWRRCRAGTLHGPGIVWYWPMVTETQRVDIRWKSLLTAIQAVTLSDGTTVSARTLTRWKPSDVLPVVSNEEDFCDTVAEMAQSVLVDVLSPCDRQLIKQVGALNVALTLEMRREMEALGIAIDRSKFVELCISPAFRLIND